jgi:hypothetical protein
MSAAAPAAPAVSLTSFKYVPNKLVSMHDGKHSTTKVGYAADMIPILTEFGLDPKRTEKVLKLTGSMIAGSAVTAALIKSFKPNDINIWVRTERFEQFHTIKDGVTLVDSEGCIFASATNGLRHHVLETLLTESGYSPDNDDLTVSYIVGLQSLPTIDSIRNYRKDDKKVNLLYTRMPLSKVLDDFDLSICCCWWQGDDIYTRFPMSLLRRELWLCDSHVCDLRDASTSERMRAYRFERIQKYIERGFTPTAATQHRMDNYLRTLKPTPSVALGAAAGAGAGAAAPKATDGVCTACKDTLMEVFHCLSDADAAHLDRKTTTDGVCSLCKMEVNRAPSDAPAALLEPKPVVAKKQVRAGAGAGASTDADVDMETHHPVCTCGCAE